MQNELLDCTLCAYTEFLGKETKNAGSVAILCDETTDTAIKQQLAVVCTCILPTGQVMAPFGGFRTPRFQMHSNFSNNTERS
jgi:hypothetical protein